MKRHPKSTDKAIHFNLWGIPIWEIPFESNFWTLRNSQPLKVSRVMNWNFSDIWEDSGFAP